jgi:hypothetical protein
LDGLEKNFVWYMSYGSNLSRERFMCYIEGGTPEGSTTTEKGCRDTSAPIKDEFVEIPYPLYFAGRSGRWDAAPAFIGLEPVTNEKTIGRMYLITKGQFMDIAAQENGLDELDIDLDKVKNKKKLRVSGRMYGTMLHVGQKDGYEIFSFTSNNDIQDVQFAKPSIAYLAMILSGILTNLSLTKEKAIEYLHVKPGVREYFSLNELKQLL